MKNKIAIIGGGVMGTALVEAILKADTGYSLLVCDKDSEKLQKISDAFPDVQTSNDLANCRDVDVVFLAVKPQDANTLEIQFNKEALICSIMAGVSIASLRRFGTDKIARMMPNTPARIGLGFTAWTATEAVGDDDKSLIEKILSAMGKHLYVESEDDIDKATAISGSGPAYVFKMLSAFVDAARDLGFSQDEAMRMVLQTLRGAEALLDEKSDLNELTRRVASKGGTTEAALNVFESHNMRETWMKAVRAAYDRAKELGR